MNSEDYPPLFRAHFPSNTISLYCKAEIQGPKGGAELCQTLILFLEAALSLQSLRLTPVSQDQQFSTQDLQQGLQQRINLISPEREKRVFHSIT